MVDPSPSEELDLVVIAVGLLHSGNLGAIARLCQNYAASRIILVAPHCQVDDRAYERATKARTYLDNILIVNTLDDVRPYVDVMIGFTARTGSWHAFQRSVIPIYEISEQLGTISGRVGIVLGREDNGLTNEEIESCDFLTIIPLEGANPVMNISHALSVGLWELLRSHTISKPRSEHRLMNTAERAALLSMLDATISHSWLSPDRSYGVVRTYKNLMGRAMLTQREANTLIGLFRGILRSLEGPHPPWDENHEPETT